MTRRWKVLIADDEAIIREGIRDAVDWEALGMEVCAEAEDGEEALALAEQHGADVMLVDLNMPIMHGLELIRLIRERMPSCLVVIITGHDEFEYAREAVRLGVEEYVLKPTNPGELAQIMTRVRSKLEREAKLSAYLDASAAQIRKNLPLLRERFCLEWMEGALSREEIAEQLAFLELPVRPPGSVMAIRWPELDTGQSPRNESERQLMLFAIENVTAELLGETEHLIFRDAAGLILLVIWDDAPPALASGIEQAVQQYLKLTVQVHLEPSGPDLAEAGAALRRARSAVGREARLSPIVRRARALIRERYADPELSLEAAAAELHVSPVYLSRILKQELGASFVSLVAMMRMEKATRLLAGTDLAIHEIAESVGYVSQHYFSTAFKKMFGVSPNQYRKGETEADEPDER
jgi:Response regulator containing CheY-like receiver domain and AraC-type DNA-binding domain